MQVTQAEIDQAYEDLNQAELALVRALRAITPCSSSFGDFQAPNEWDKEFEPWELEDMRRLRQGLQDFPFGVLCTAFNHQLKERPSCLNSEMHDN